jgi:beta-lactamase superfamily II metal-dependent hydrolase
MTISNALEGMVSDTPLLRRIGRLASAAGLLLSVAACGTGTPVDPPVPPQITIAGVEDGGVYEEPVTIEISVDRGSVSSTLNGETIYSGTTVEAPGEYLLEVTARAAGLESTERVEFEITFAGDRMLILRMIDLGPHVPWGGGGDALLLTDSTAAGMVHGMVDAGPGGFQEGVIDYDYVANQLAALGVDTLRFLQLTHAHADHYAGMQTILDRVHVRKFIYNGQVRTQTGYNNALSRAEARADSVLVVMSEWEYALGVGQNATRTVHIPGLPDYLGVDTDDGRMLNEGSLGTYVEMGGVRLFLTGDGENQANDRWRTQFAGYTEGLDILKVGHHGANNAIFDDRVGASQTSTWLDHTRPRFNLITANGVSHPRQRALNRLLGLQNTDTYCTNVHGTVEVRITDDGRINITPERNPDQDCRAGSEAHT